MRLRTIRIGFAVLLVSGMAMAVLHQDGAAARHAGLDDPGACPTPQSPCQTCLTIRQPVGVPTSGISRPLFIRQAFVGADLQVGPPLAVSPSSLSRAPPLA